VGRQRLVVEAFFAAAREGDFGALDAVLDPGVVLRIDAGAARPAASIALRGADAVARQALTGLTSGLNVVQVRPALVNGAAGVTVLLRGRPVTVMGFTIVNGKIAEIDAIGDPERLVAITAPVSRF